MGWILGLGVTLTLEVIIITADVCILSHSSSQVTSSPMLLWKHICRLTVCLKSVSLHSRRSLAWVTAFKEPSYTELGKALVAALGALPVHIVSASSTGGIQYFPNPRMYVPH